MKKIIIFILVCIAFSEARAQQNPMISQYMFNGLILNPGYAGSKDYISAAALYRKQWVDFKGSPETQTATIHGPLKNRKMGLGFTLVNDKVGVTNRTDFMGSYAYHIKTRKGKLALGLQAGASLYKAKFSDLIYWDKADVVFDGDVQSNLLPNAGAGAYYYARKFYAGLSVPHLLDYDPNKSLSFDVERVPHATRHYFLHTGYVVEFSDDLKMKPSVLVKYVANAPVEADININFLFSNTFWLGASYRTGDAVVGIVEYQLTKQLRFGYAYDFTLTELRNHSSGSHEIMLGYDFGYDIQKVKSPRYF